MGNAAQLVVAGGTLLDESVTLQDSLHPGESNRADWSSSIGGVACNVYRAAAPLVNTALFSAIGDDDTGKTIKHSLETSSTAANSSVSFKVSKSLATGRYSAVLDQQGELVIGLANSDVTDLLVAEEILQALAEQQQAQILAIDTNLSSSCVKEICRHFETTKRSNKLAAVAVSPVKCMRLVDYGACVDYLFLNRQEAAMLSGLPASSDLMRLSDALIAMQFSSHVLSDGAAEILVCDAENAQLLPVGTLSQTKSVNGAGDALAGATLASLCRGQSLTESVRLAGIAAAQTVINGQSLLPWPLPRSPAASPSASPSGPASRHNSTPTN